MRWFFLLLPWIELFTLIRLGNHIGALSTVLYVFLTLILGVTILRLQGEGILRKLQASAGPQMVAPQFIGGELAMGLAGFLLMIPGLVTDTLALPIIVLALVKRLGADSADRPPTGGPHIRPDNTIEGEFRRLDDD